WVREGWPGLKLTYPHLSGADGAGDVEGLGGGVNEFAVGDRVVIDGNLGCGVCGACLSGNDHRCQDWHLLGETIRGTLAEYVVVPARNLLKVPDSIDYGQAAAASLVFLTAWHSLITRGQLQAGETVLVIGASGGVNTASIQIAKLAGATVLVIGANAKKLALAESLGADTLIDRSKEENWSKAVYLATNRKGVDVVVDNVGAGTMPLSMRAAAKGGRILTVGNTGGPTFEIDNRFIFGKHLSIIGSTMSPIEDFRTVMGLIFNGRLKPVIDRHFPLQDASEAQRRLEAGEQLGKIVLDISS
ncbi:MAG: zinc-binding dehydrogenase, partial [Anaerolineales bacterium]|nr:zinc-binding dehydrogenase [Anaerolineales bacterium]